MKCAVVQLQDELTAGVCPRGICLPDVRVLADRYPIRRIILFGSLARGNFAPGSDIDLAVEGLPPGDYFTALAAANCLTRFWVDLKPLEELQPRFRERVLATGECVYERALGDRTK